MVEITIGVGRRQRKEVFGSFAPVELLVVFPVVTTSSCGSSFYSQFEVVNWWQLLLLLCSGREEWNPCWLDTELANTDKERSVVAKGGCYYLLINSIQS
jgi:hypothetical protein